MEQKKLIMLFMFIGSTVGSFVPSLWDAGMFSLWGLVFSALGGFAGIWAGYRLGE
jgi:hypothetical protein